MRAPFISGEELRDRISYDAAIEAVEEAFAGPPALTPIRTVLERDEGQLLLMPSWGDDGLGVKLVTVNPANPRRDLPLIQGIYVLFSAETLTPIALIDAGALTAIRTGAVSAVATKHLAEPNASRLVVFGSGVQAEAHVRALARVRSLTDIAIVPTSPGRAASLVGRLVAEGFPAREGSVGDLRAARLICTCTTSTTPLFDGTELAPGVHINAVGAHGPDAREVDDATVTRAYVVVETRDAAAAEAGDLLIPLAAGVADAGKVPAADLAEVVRGGAPPLPEGAISLFKSVGVAFEDLAVARAAFRKS